MQPKPVQQPHPPICIGGTGERRTLRTAARFAQHWNFAGGTVERVGPKLDVLHQHCATSGAIQVRSSVSSHVGFEGDAKETAAAAAEMGEAGLDLAIVQLRPPHRPDVLEPLAEALAQVD